MDRESIREAKARTSEIIAYAKERVQFAWVAVRLVVLFSRTHETVDGQKKRMTKRRKESKGNDLIDQAFDGEIDVREDVKNQVKIMDRDA